MTFPSRLWSLMLAGSLALSPIHERGTKEQTTTATTSATP